MLYINDAILCQNSKFESHHPFYQFLHLLVLIQKQKSLFHKDFLSSLTADFMHRITNTPEMTNVLKDKAISEQFWNAVGNDLVSLSEIIQDSHSNHKRKSG